MDCETTTEAIQRVSTDLQLLTPDTSSTASSGSDDREKDLIQDEVIPQQLSRLSQLIESINRTATPDIMRLIRHHLDNHPEMFQKFPSVVGNKLYPAPHALGDQIQREGFPVPRFLTDISDPEHIPPHIVACSLLSEIQSLKEEVHLLRVKLDHV